MLACFPTDRDVQPHEPPSPLGPRHYPAPLDREDAGQFSCAQARELVGLFRTAFLAFARQAMIVFVTRFFPQRRGRGIGMSESSALHGGCLCGACRYESFGRPLNSRVCHCRRCQKATGSAFYARVMVPLDRVRITGPVRWFDAGTGVRRGFCGECGTTLFSERRSANTIGLSMGSLDDADGLAPSDHIWVSAKQRWLTFDDGLPQYPEGPPGSPSPHTTP
ncbi:GFA family protein [Acidisoma sp. C75]